MHLKVAKSDGFKFLRKKILNVQNGEKWKILIMPKMGRWIIFGSMSIFNELVSKSFHYTLLEL